MAKEKVYKLAQEFKVSSEALVQMLRGMGIVVKSHMSTVDESLRDEIKKKFEHERAEIKKEYERKKMMLNKAREELISDSPVEQPGAVPMQAPVQGEIQSRSKLLSEPGVSHQQTQRQAPVQDQRPLVPAPPLHHTPYQSENRRGQYQPRPNQRPPFGGQGGQGQGQGQGYQGGQGAPRPGQGQGYQGGQGAPRPGQGQGYQGGQGAPRPGQGQGYQGGQGAPRPGQGQGYQGGQGAPRPGQGQGYQGGQGAPRPGQGQGYQGGQGQPQPGGAGVGTGAGAGAGQRPPFRRYERDDRGSWVNKDANAPAIKTPLTPQEIPATPLKTAEEGRKKVKDKKKGKKGRNERPEINEVELKANVKKTLARIGSGSTRKKYKKDPNQKDSGEDIGEQKILNVAEFISASELANMMTVPASEIIAKCLELGLFVTINQRLDFETIEMIADEFGFAAQLMTEYTEEDVETVEDDKDKHRPRAPVVTVMGHVDHGKTSLLDYIRKTNVISGEAGGITQHIAAYEVKTKQGSVTFLDTPGHEAFTAMRARGSQITDVIVLVVAADSGVMPQTKEAIDHARAAQVPLVIAINKVDLPTANIEKVKNELAQYNVLVDVYGGQTSCVEISAKTGAGVEKLLEVLALETEILELTANPEGRAQGVVVESELDKGKGAIATVLVQKGTIHKGDAFVTGIHSGRVRELYNERGVPVNSAGPSQPVLVLGMSGTPQAGDSFRVVEDEKEAREISGRRRLAAKERELRHIGAVSLDHLYEQIKAGAVQNLNLIIKGDVDGSVEALAASLEKLSTEEIKVCVIHKSVGAVRETDIMLAAASNALIVGFHLSPNTKIRELAKLEGVDIRTYRIIYEAVDAVKAAMEGMLKPEIKENIIAQVRVRRVFTISKVGTVAGCMVESGSIVRGSKARLIRDDVELSDTKISSLRRGTDDVREVATGYECGITLDRVNDYKENDRIEVYEEVEVARKLS